VSTYTVIKYYEIPGFFLTKPSRDWDCMGTLFPARESLVSDILAGDRKSLNLYLQCTHCKQAYARFQASVWIFLTVVSCSSSCAVVARGSDVHTKPDL